MSSAPTTIGYRWRLAHQVGSRPPRFYEQGSEDTARALAKSYGKLPNTTTWVERQPAGAWKLPPFDDSDVLDGMDEETRGACEAAREMVEDETRAPRVTCSCGWVGEGWTAGKDHVLAAMRANEDRPERTAVHDVRESWEPGDPCGACGSTNTAWGHATEGAVCLHCAATDGDDT